MKIACFFILLAISFGASAMNPVKLKDFLSDHSTKEKVVQIKVEPKIIYLDEAGHQNFLNFDFILKGLTDKELMIRFIKVGVYDLVLI